MKVEDSESTGLQKEKKLLVVAEAPLEGQQQTKQLYLVASVVDIT